MKVLVTGGAGYLGSITTRVLLSLGHNVRVFDSLMYTGDSLLGVWNHPDFEFVKGDIRDARAVDKALEDIQAVVHLAAIVGDPACTRQPELAKEVNLKASLQLIELSQRHGVERFVFASTCSNYGRMTDADGYADEESELRPISLYAETKVATERFLLDSSSTSTPAATVLRFATLFGISPRPRFDLTVNEFTAELVTKKRLAVYGEQFWRPYVHVEDAAQGIALVLSSPVGKVAGQVFNVGNTNLNYQKRQLVEIILAHIEGEVDIEWVHKEEDPRDYRVAFERIQATLGYRARRTVDDGIREIISAVTQGIIEDPGIAAYRN